MNLMTKALGGALLAMLSACGGGGGGAGSAASTVTAPTALSAAVMAVLVAEGDATGEAIAAAYQTARGVPAANIVRVPVPAGSDSLTPEAFATLKAAVDARVPATAQALLLTWTRPSRVVPASGACVMSITSALTLGYDARYCGGCVATAASSYYNSDSHAPWTDLRLRPAMMLGAATLADAQTLINRGVAADGSLVGGSPVAQAWLVRTTDANRSARYTDFRTLANTSVAGVKFNYVDNSAGTGSNFVTGQRDVLWYFTGLERVTGAATNTYLPGAVGDHLTSYGGLLPDGLGQMTVLDWLQAGVTGSYGTVVEPCAFVEKFPRASVMVTRYQRGDTLIEAYWKSVQWPGEGLFVGEPLARPFAR
jgi:uncharacterized protein (TIGR03790 family)